jgi:hypothetical protein
LKQNSGKLLGTSATTKVGKPGVKFASDLTLSPFSPAYVPQKDVFKVLKTEIKQLTALNLVSRWIKIPEGKALLEKYVQRMSQYYDDLFARNAQNEKVRKCLDGKVAATIKRKGKGEQ